MPWADLAELLGASAIVMAVLVVFWKGDDAISKEFRDDLAAWLILLKPPPGKSPVAQTVLAMFERVFGKKHLSWRCISLSFAVSTFFGISFYCFLFAISPVIRISHAANSATFEISLFWGVLVGGAITNGLGDFPSLYVTRKILQLCSAAKMMLWLAVLVDFVLTVLVFILTIWAISFALNGFQFPPLSRVFPVFENLVLITLGFDSSLSAAKNHSAEALIRAFVFTAFITSFWLWAAALGTLVIRVLARSGPILRALQYVLPIEDKPVRSLGIVGFLMFFIYSLVIFVLKSLGLL